MAAVLGIGNATLDIIHSVDAYPREDEEIRCHDRILRRGGNAANTLVVLSQMGHACSWAGVLVNNADGKIIREDLLEHAVDPYACRLVDTGSVPVSTIILNTSNGSRTIVHFRDLPEYELADLERAELAHFDWLHFEGRNVQETGAMLQWARSRHPEIPRSLEVEKPRAGIEQLFCDADVLLFSQVYGRFHGHNDPLALLRTIRVHCPDVDLFCTWGDAGAAALDRRGQEWNQAAVVPLEVVDTLGAGDTFNAAVINGFLEGLQTASILVRACALAGKKCGQTGFDGLVDEEPERHA